jgi:hypothetical protein
MKVLSHEADSLDGEMYAHVAGRKQQYTKLVRRILADVQTAQPSARPKLDLTVATYALFGMMNWIYNWYDPRGKLSVNDLVDNVARLFLSGFLPGADGAELTRPFAAQHGEQLSVWRAHDTPRTARQK